MITYSQILAITIRFFKEQNLFTQFTNGLYEIYENCKEYISKEASDKGAMSPYMINQLFLNSKVHFTRLSVQQCKQLGEFIKWYNLAIKEYQKQLIKAFMESNSPLLKQFKQNLNGFAFSWHGKHDIDAYLSWVENSTHINQFIRNSFPWSSTKEGFPFWQGKSEMLENGEKFW